MQLILKRITITMTVLHLSTHICSLSVFQHHLKEQHSISFICYLPYFDKFNSKHYYIYINLYIIYINDIRSGANKGCVFSKRLKGRTTVVCGSRRSHMQIVPSRAPVAKSSAICKYFFNHHN